MSENKGVPKVTIAVVIGAGVLISWALWKRRSLNVKKREKKQLSDFSVQEIIETQHPDKQKELISVTPTTTLEDVLRLFSKYNITSAPVKTSQSSKQPYSAIVNVLDIGLSLVLPTARSEKSSLSPQESVTDIQSKLSHATVQSVLGVSSESWTRPVFSYREPLSLVFEKFSTGLHRALVKRKDHAWTFVTQMDLLRFVKAHKELFPSHVLHSSLAQLGLIQTKGESKQKDLVVATTHDTALAALQKLYDSGFENAALPVLDDDNNLVASFSASDLRKLDASAADTLLLPVNKFLEQVYGDQIRPPVAVTRASSLDQCVDFIVAHKIHRVWVYDTEVTSPERKKGFTGVVSLTDIIRLFFQNAKGTSLQ